jgi:hypothetical protein
MPELSGADWPDAFHRRDAEGAEKKKIFHRKGAKDAKQKENNARKTPAIPALARIHSVAVVRCSCLATIAGTTLMFIAIFSLRPLRLCGESLVVFSAPSASLR